VPKTPSKKKNKEKVAIIKIESQLSRINLRQGLLPKNETYYKFHQKINLVSFGRRRPKVPDQKILTLFVASVLPRRYFSIRRASENKCTKFKYQWLTPTNSYFGCFLSEQTPIVHPTNHCDGHCQTGQVWKILSSFETEYLKV
jgi:hypothetical protein